MKSHTLFVVAMFFSLVSFNAGAQDKKDDANTQAEKSQQELENDFKKTMTGAVLVGSFNISGEKKQGPVKEERYTIKKVSKEKNDTWLVYARMQYGKRDVTLPVPVKLKWAGDTPVITLTDLQIPSLGTFTARVLIYRNHYAGYWQHDEVTGSMWGRIERAEEEKKAE